MASLALRDIEKRLGKTSVLRGVSLDVRAGELVVLVGASGCGKSTLLRIVAGLESPDKGTVRIGDRDVTRLSPRDRDVAMVFQSYALYPHMKVRDNLTFGLKLRGADAETIAERLEDVTSMLGLAGLLDRYPRQLSGGQRQRVAMGRAIARRPALFLFDEPLSNLDASLRAEVRVEIRRLHARLGTTTVYVTHDQTEAMTLADRLVVLNAGKVEQVGTPLEVYRAPATRFVAGFLGSPKMNFLEADLGGGTAQGDGFELPVGSNATGMVVVGIRPHDARLATPGTLRMCVDVVESLGSEAHIHGRVGGQPFVACVPADAGVKPGDVVGFDVAENGLHLFELRTGSMVP